MTKILLVEDDKSLREIYGVRLLAEGYDIVSAGDGEEALAMAIKERPDLIISDVMMPKISGFEMLDLLKSNESTRNIKVIMMTALSSEQQRQRGESLGADRYLVKSQVGIEDVVRTTHEVLGDQNQASAPATAEPMQSPVNPPQATRPTTFANPRQPSAPQQPQAIVQPEPIATPQPTETAQSFSQPTPPATPQYMQQPPATDQPTTLPEPGMQSQTAPTGDLAQSGSSMKSHKLEPTGETLTPQVDINALLAKEQAKEIGGELPPAPAAMMPEQPPIPTTPQPPVQQVQIDPNGMLTSTPEMPVAAQSQFPVQAEPTPQSATNPFFQQPPTQ